MATGAHGVGQVQGWQVPSVLSDDPSLTVSIDVGHVPITIHLGGTLDERTGSNVVPVVSELIAAGGRQFELDTTALGVPDEGGVAVLADLQLAVRASGGCLQWGPPTVRYPSEPMDAHSDRPVDARTAPSRRPRHA